jgi:hypothetical protein
MTRIIASRQRLANQLNKLSTICITVTGWVCYTGGQIRWRVSHMSSLNRFFQLAGLASILALLAACTSTPKISTDYDPEYDFASIKTYYLVEHNLAAQPGGTSLSDQRATREISAEMKRRGISPASVEQADIILTFHIVRQDRTKVTSYNNSYGYSRYGSGRGGYYGGNQVDVRQYTEGTLLVDLVAPKEKRIVWRGQTSAVIRDRSNEERDARARMYVEAMFNHMPPPIGMTQK